MAYTIRTIRMAVPLACGLLAACGGDGPVNSVSASKPFPQSASGTFSAATATQTYTGSLNSGQFGSQFSKPLAVTPATTAGINAATTIAYDAATGIYTVQAGSTSASFTAADKMPSSDYTTSFNKGGDSLTLYGNAQPGNTATAPVSLSYTSFGKWTHVDASADQTDIRYYVFGEMSGSKGMPTSGSATYATTVSGTMLAYNYAPATLSDLTGTATFTADFAQGTVSTGLSLRAVGNPTEGSAGVYSGSGTIAKDQFAGTFTSGTNYFASGAFNGAFFGPSAAEMGYTFAIKGHNPDPYAGASVSPGDISIVGAVVGAKK